MKKVKVVINQKQKLMWQQIKLLNEQFGSEGWEKEEIKPLVKIAELKKAIDFLTNQNVVVLAENQENVGGYLIPHVIDRLEKGKKVCDLCELRFNRVDEFYFLKNIGKDYLNRKN